MNQNPEKPVVTRYVSRGSLHFDVFVSHRDSHTVKYTMGNDETVYEKTPAEFDASYILPSALRR